MYFPGDYNLRERVEVEQGGSPYNALSTFNIRITKDHLTIETTSTGPIGGLSCEVLLYFNWSHRWSQL